MTRALLVAALASFVLVPGLEAYLKLGAQAGDRVVALRWNRTIRYAVTERGAPGVSPVELQAAVDRAFRTWAAVANVNIDVEFAGFTSAEPFADDGVSVIGFASRPDMDRTLGAATHEVNEGTGQLVASDIFLNTGGFDWSVAANGQPGRFDVESIALHEIGHFLGLGHSMLGETTLSSGGRQVLGKRAVMFPFAYGPGNIEDRTLEADDIAGITDSYGTSAANRALGAVNGRITLNGRGVFGAHISAFNPATGALVGGFSLGASGDFVIAGLAPGLYVVRAEPLDDADLDDILGNDPEVELDFRVTYHPQLVAVPAGGTSGEIEIKVRAK